MELVTDKTTETNAPVAGNELAVISNAANQLFVAERSPFKKTALVLDAEVDYTEEDLFALGETIANFDKASKFWQGDFCIEMQKRFPDAYKRATEMFGVKYNVMRNIVYTCNNVPAENRVPGLSFTHHEEVAQLRPDEQPTLLAKALNFVDPVTNEKRVMTKDELRHAVQVHKKGPGSADETGEEGATQTEQLVAPYTKFHLDFRGMEAGENKNAYATLLDTHIAEQRKRHLDPKYAAKAAQAERKAMFDEVLEGVIKADRAQFVTMYDNGATIPEIRNAVKQYFDAAREVEELEKALAGVPADDQEQFFTMRSEGKKLSEVKDAIKAYTKKKADREQLDILLKDVTDEVKKGEFLKSFDEGTDFKTLKETVKKHVKDAKTAADKTTAVNKLLEAVPEEDRAQFLLMHSEGKELSVIKDAVKAYKDTAAQTAKDATAKSVERRKTLRTEIKKTLEAANALRDTNDQNNILDAEKLEKKAEGLQAELDKLETAATASAGAVSTAAPVGDKTAKMVGKKATGTAKKSGSKKAK